MKFNGSEMVNSLIRTNYEALHAITEHWVSDLNFYGDELHFLDDLIDKYIGLMMRDEDAERIRKMTIQFAEVKKHHLSLIGNLPRHLKELKSILLNPFSHEEHHIVQEHQQLEEYTAAFVKSFRELKREIFAITRHVLREEKLKKYLKD